MSNVLEGVRVLDLTHVLAGPFAGYQLAVMGAEVIKIESPDEPDQARFQGSDAQLNDEGMGTAFLSQSSNKKSMALNLKTERGRQVLRQPQQYFKAGLESTWLDRMGVVTPPDLGGAQLDFGLMKLGEAEDSVRERVVFPGSITRRDLLQWRERWPQ